MLQVLLSNTNNCIKHLPFAITELKKSKVGDRSRGQPEGTLFNSYYNKV